ncbi:MAG: hypothetical protein ACXWYS_02200 [Gaiellaceae bacterium]
MRGQAGMALPMVLGMMVIFAIALGTVMIETTAVQNTSKRGTAEGRALSLAEAGLGTALSILNNAADPTSPSAVGSGSNSLNGGTASWTGTLSGTTWTLTGTGSLPSPTAGAGTVRRTASVDVAVNPTSAAWKYLFADNAAGCMSIANNATIAAPVYSRGNLCISNNAHLTGSPVQVEGNVTIGNNGSIGSAGTPVAVAYLASCGSPSHACSTADRVYATSLTSTPQGLTKPTIDLAGWYANAKPGPSHNCTSGTVPGGFDTDATLNRSRATYNLTSGSSYDCQYWENGSMVGRLKWDSATSTLTVLGTILFDGSIALSGTATYSGRATIYATGRVTSSNNTSFCGIAGCTGSWDPDTNLAVLVAGEPTTNPGISLANNSSFQGAMYAVLDYNASNNVTNWGPVIARSVSISNNAGQIMSLSSVPPGAPGAAGGVQPLAGTWR